MTIKIIESLLASGYRIIRISQRFSKLPMPISPVETFDELITDPITKFSQALDVLIPDAQLSENPPLEAVPMPSANLAHKYFEPSRQRKISTSVPNVEHTAPRTRLDEIVNLPLTKNGFSPVDNILNIMDELNLSVTPQNQDHEPQPTTVRLSLTSRRLAATPDKIGRVPDQLIAGGAGQSISLEARGQRRKTRADNLNYSTHNYDDQYATFLPSDSSISAPTTAHPTPPADMTVKQGVRMAQSPSQLAATLRANLTSEQAVSTTPTLSPFKQVPTNEAQYEQPQDTPINLEQVLDQLSDRLEFEFLRTYGTAGGGE